MFNLFKKKETEIKVIDKIVIDEKAKLAALLIAWNTDKNTVFVFWFDETFRQAESFFTAQRAEPVMLLTAREAAAQHLSGKTVIFAEHYPLYSKEKELYEKMKLERVTVYSSLNEAFFKVFGADRIIHVMKQLGVKEDEVIEHKMISQSIRNAQKKIEKKIITEQAARSQNDWLEKNFENN